MIMPEGSGVLQLGRKCLKKNKKWFSTRKAAYSDTTQELFLERIWVCVLRDFFSRSVGIENIILIQI